MVRRSLGKFSKRTRLLRKRVGAKRLGISRIVKKFAVGDTVHIDIKIGFSGPPHPRYRGRTGVIVGTRGKAYLVKIRDYNVKKELAIPGVHLR